MPTSNAASVHERVCSNPTPPAKVSHEPSEISETSRSEEPSLRYLMMLLSVLLSAFGGGSGCVLVVGDVLAPVGLGPVISSGKRSARCLGMSTPAAPVLKVMKK